MKKIWKKYAAVAMAGVLSAGMLTGCGDKKEEAFDGTKVVATVNGEEIPMGLLSFVVRNQQAYTKAMYEAYGLGAYIANLWDGPVSEDSEMTYGEQTRGEVLEQVELMYILRNKAAEYGVEITAEEQEKIAAAASAFMAVNSEETIATLGVSEDIMKTYLELETYFAKLRGPIMADADHEVSDEQAQMSSFSYVHITAKEEDTEDEDLEEIVEDMEDADAEAVVEETAEEEAEEPVEEEETEAEETEAEETEEAAEEEVAAEPTEAELKAKENAEAFQKALSADPKADITELIKTFDESLYALNGTFQTNLSEDWEDDTASYYNEDMIAALRDLKEGEITGVIETEDGGYYVARLEKEMDEEATESERESIISDRENAFYTETTQAWLGEAEIVVNEEVLALLKVTDSMIFTTVSNNGEEEILDEDADVEVEEIETEEEPAEVEEEAPAAEDTAETSAEETAVEETVEEAAEGETPEADTEETEEK